MEKTNEILTIAGERVEVRYSAKSGDCCYKCRFWSDEYGMCRAERADSTPPCQDYDSKEGGFAYFVPAKESGERDFREKAEIIKAIIEAKGFRYTHDEMMRMTKKELLAYYKEIEGTPQEVTLIPSNDDEDEAAEMAARRAYPYEGGTKGDICEASIPIFCKGFKAGIAWERERLMKELGKEMFTSNPKETNLYKMGAADERERIIKMVETAGARFMRRVDIVPEDEASLKLSMYCTELVEQIKSQSNS